MLQARCVDKVTLGTFTGITLALNWSLYLQLGILNGLSRELPYFFGRGDHARVRQLAATARAWAVCLGVLVECAFAGKAIWCFWHGQIQLGIGWMTHAGIAVMTFYSASYLMATYRTAHDFARLSLANVVQNAMGVACVIFVYWAGFNGICLRAEISMLAGVLVLHLWRPIRVPWQWSFGDFKHLLAIGFPIFIVGELGSRLLFLIDITLVSHYLQAGGLGLYNVVGFARRGCRGRPARRRLGHVPAHDGVFRPHARFAGHDVDDLPTDRLFGGRHVGHGRCGMGPCVAGDQTVIARLHRRRAGRPLEPAAAAGNELRLRPQRVQHLPSPASLRGRDRVEHGELRGHFARRMPSRRLLVGFSPVVAGPTHRLYCPGLRIPDSRISDVEEAAESARRRGHMNPVARLQKAVRMHGGLGTLRLAGGMVARPLLKPLQNWWATRYLRVNGRRFDRRYHVETSGWIDGAELDAGANIRHATAYAGIVPAPFHAVMKQMPIDFSKHVFVDFGSGKGRALFLAAAYPFARIVGVEFSPQLHSAAESNCRTFRGPDPLGDRVELHCADAAQFDIPAEPALLFFFNPFGEAVMRPIAEKVEASLAANPRSLVVVYFWPMAGKVWEGLRHVVPLTVRQPNWAWPAHRGRTIVSVWASRDVNRK